MVTVHRQSVPVEDPADSVRTQEHASCSDPVTSRQLLAETDKQTCRYTPANRYLWEGESSLSVCHSTHCLNELQSLVLWQSGFRHPVDEFH
jgi:hypothetical protein